MVSKVSFPFFNPNCGKIIILTNCSLADKNDLISIGRQYNNNIYRYTILIISVMKNISAIKTSLLATIPILLFGITWIFEFSEVDKTVYYASLLVSITSMFVLLGFGWIRDFPNWTIHSIGFCLLLSVYLMTISIPELFGGNLLGLWGLLPIGLTMLVSIAFNFSWKPLRQLYSKVKNDKSLLIFGLYGFLPVFLMFLLDEVH